MKCQGNEAFSIKQENITLIECCWKFNEVLRYTPKLINTKKEKARHFKTSLSELLCDTMVAQHLPTYVVVFHWAQNSKMDLKWTIIRKSLETKKSYSKKLKVDNAQKKFSQCATWGKKYEDIGSLKHFLTIGKLDIELRIV